MSDNFCLSDVPFARNQVSHLSAAETWELLFNIQPQFFPEKRGVYKYHVSKCKNLDLEDHKGLNRVNLEKEERDSEREIE